ncbi:oxidoreductase [Brevundimonas sp. SORGH_AS_0993]|uniref:oxidoreductase n=1 Tax=Brevundimonas sp. SORGH_AS_0993 TaxID=3041794 RepID=UPI0027887FDA|nr:oxidoreductase [Brevundimonas sp. SORGH_AS_0993]MDQ1153645.1 NAD(P)-dependent dehydrogenase (short-subunit alcohol dehydrogenase family) [Brevundimonas sp. SORGH_AS_0993]
MKTWLITGVSSGFGRALAQAVLARGDRVAGTVRNTPALSAFEALAPGLAHGVVMDVVDPSAVTAAVSAVTQALGPIDVLVNNAGYGLVSGIEEASLDEIRAQFEVNVFGAVTVMQAVLPAMRARRSGTIVNVTSVSGLVGWPGLGVYSGSKFALEGITETLAQEVAPFGIGVMMVEPGGFRTDFAGRSRVEASSPIADYDGTVLSDCKAILHSHAGQERGDPALAAQAILTALEAEHPPLRLLLGSDAVSYLKDKISAQLSEVDRWEAVSTATDFETVVAAE